MAKMAERRKATDDKIFRSAVIEFGINGYSNTTLSKIAISSGVTPGLIVQNFGSKEELYNRVVKEIFDHLKDAFGSFSSTWDIRYVSIVEYFVNTLNNNPKAIDYLRFFVTLVTSKDTPDNSKERLHSFYNDSPVEMMIKEGQKRGDVIAGDPYIINKIFWINMIDNICYCFENKLEYPSSEWFLQTIRKR